MAVMFVFLGSWEGEVEAQWFPYRPLRCIFLPAVYSPWGRIRQGLLHPSWLVLLVFLLLTFPPLGSISSYFSTCFYTISLSSASISAFSPPLETRSSLMPLRSFSGSPGNWLNTSVTLRVKHQRFLSSSVVAFWALTSSERSTEPYVPLIQDPQFILLSASCIPAHSFWYKGQGPKKG